MDSGLRIRLARIFDADRIERLQERSLLRLGSRYYGREAIESFLRLVGTLDTRLIQDRTYYVAEVDGRMVGCGGWTFRAAAVPGGGPTPAPRLDPDRDAAFVRAIYVAPESARRGVGSALMEQAESDIAGAGFARAQLVATLSGEPLYRKLGYREIGRLAVHLPDGNVLQGVRMEKNLREAATMRESLPAATSPLTNLSDVA